MRSLLFAIVMSAMSTTLLAQDDCSDAAILDKAGNWKKHPDANLRNDRNQAQIFRCIDSIGKLFQAAIPEPKGFEAAWYRSMGDPLLPGWPTSYTFNSLYFCWFCSKEIHKLELSGETGTWTWVYVNHWGWFFGDRPRESDLKVDSTFIYNMPDKVGTWKGYDLYQSVVQAPRNRCILLARRGTLPWKPVTQEQYLKSVRALLEDQKKKLQPQPQAAAGINKYFDQQIAVVDNYLHNTPASQLQQPAILPRHGRTMFDGSFTTLQNGGQMKVAINRDYPDHHAPGYRPQFMVIYWCWEDKNAGSMNFKQQFEANFPVDRLQAMLDQ